MTEKSSTDSGTGPSSSVSMMKFTGLSDIGTGIVEILGKAFVQRIGLFEHRVSPDGSTAFGCSPVLAEDVGSTEFLGAFRLVADIFTSSHTALWMKIPTFLPNQIGGAGIRNGIMTSSFVKSYRLLVTRDFYRMVENREISEGDTWNTEHALSYLGTSAYAETNHLKIGEKEPTLGSFEHCAIHVNLSTRRPHPIPDAIREQLQGASLSEKPQRLSFDWDTPSDVPVFRSSLEVEDSYMDANGHVNLYVYQWMVIGCAQAALKQGVLRKHSKGLHRVKEFGAVHEGEALAGDSLTMEAWEADDEIIHVLVSRLNDKLVLARFEFHGCESADTLSRL